ncbi:MAG: sulfide/dihydroorotate dehydrogenase-like FAD/NAD-binding protein [Fervidobacterium sp.]
MFEHSDTINKIISKRKLSKGIHELWIFNPFVSRHTKPGQFVIIKVSEKGERIPLTIAETNGDNFRIVVKAVGKSTYELCSLKESDVLFDVAGPLGKPSEVKFYGNVLVIGGGVGIAAIYPIAKALKEVGNKLTVIIGARTIDDLIMKDEFEFADRVIKATDDGSSGQKGTVIDFMEEELRNSKYDIIWAVGPAIMMKFASEVADKHNLPIWVSLNSVMIDGTGMCGGCRTLIKNEKDGEIKYVCVDGPEFDGRYVDWDSFMKRLNQYREQEKIALERYLAQIGDTSWL